MTLEEARERATEFFNKHHQYGQSIDGEAQKDELALHFHGKAILEEKYDNLKSYDTPWLEEYLGYPSPRIWSCFKCKQSVRRVAKIPGKPSVIVCHFCWPTDIEVSIKLMEIGK